MKRDLEKRPHDPHAQGRRPARSRAAAGSAPVIAGVVALALSALVALLFLCGPPEPAAVDVALQSQARTEAMPAPPVARAEEADPSRLRESDAPAVAERRLRVTPRRRSDLQAAAAEPEPGAEVEEVIENEPGEELPPGIDAGDYIRFLREMGETEGIAAFPPPGTSPPRAGVIVPDDYALPEGYERYYQYSDDGKPFAPILVYSPDYEFFDEQGEPIHIPEDRLVPPDQAPPDLPVEILDPESPLDPEGLIDPLP